jgi:Protein of unknwon function (DUF3310)
MKYTHDNYLQLSDGDILSAYKIAFGYKRISGEEVIVRVRKDFNNKKMIGGWCTFYAELDKYIDAKIDGRPDFNIKFSEKFLQDMGKVGCSNVNHPTHYGGEDNPYEAIKVIEAWDLGFNLGNVVKYLSRAGKKGETLEDLRKAAWYLNREIQNRENE